MRHDSRYRSQDASHHGSNSLRDRRACQCPCCPFRSDFLDKTVKKLKLTQLSFPFCHFLSFPLQCFPLLSIAYPTLPFLSIPLHSFHLLSFYFPFFSYPFLFVHLDRSVNVVSYFCPFFPSFVLFGRLSVFPKFRTKRTVTPPVTHQRGRKLPQPTRPIIRVLHNPLRGEGIALPHLKFFASTLKV